uniref:Homeobox domain-containing protein n=1 Tax=Romanomermis culicivorax TaxID=13658 RepID=A0A915I2D7_ROMCU
MHRLSRMLQEVKVWFQNRRTKYKRHKTDEESRKRCPGGSGGSLPSSSSDSISSMTHIILPQQASHSNASCSSSTRFANQQHTSNLQNNNVNSSIDYRLYGMGDAGAASSEVESVVDSASSIDGEDFDVQEKIFSMNSSSSVLKDQHDRNGWSKGCLKRLSTNLNVVIETTEQQSKQQPEQPTYIFEKTTKCILMPFSLSSKFSSTIFTRFITGCLQALASIDVDFISDVNGNQVDKLNQLKYAAVDDHEGISAAALQLVALMLLMGATRLLRAGLALPTSAEVTVRCDEGLMTIDAIFGTRGVIIWLDELELESESGSELSDFSSTWWAACSCNKRRRFTEHGFRDSNGATSTGHATLVKWFGSGSSYQERKDEDNDTKNDPSIDSTSYINGAMWGTWLLDSAKKCPQLPWVLLNEPFEVSMLWQSGSANILWGILG